MAQPKYRYGTGEREDLQWPMAPKGVPLTLSKSVTHISYTSPKKYIPRAFNTISSEVNRSSSTDALHQQAFITSSMKISNRPQSSRARTSSAESLASRYTNKQRTVTFDGRATPRQVAKKHATVVSDSEQEAKLHPSVARLETTFESLDTDGSGILTPDELRSVLTECPDLLPAPLLRRIYQQLDSAPENGGIVYSALIANLNKHFSVQDKEPVVSMGEEGRDENTQLTATTTFEIPDVLYSVGGLIWGLRSKLREDPEAVWQAFKDSVDGHGGRFDKASLRGALVCLNIRFVNTHLDILWEHLSLASADTMADVFQRIQGETSTSAMDNGDNNTTQHVDDAIETPHETHDGTMLDPEDESTFRSTGSFPTEVDLSATHEASNVDVERGRRDITKLRGDSLVAEVQKMLSQQRIKIFPSLTRVEKHGMVTRLSFRNICDRYIGHLDDSQFNWLCTYWGLGRLFDFRQFFHSTIDPQLQDSWQDSSYRGFVGRVAEQLQHEKPVLEQMLRKADKGSSSTISFKSFKKVFGQWFGGFASKKNMDRLVQPFAVMVPSPAENLYVKNDKMISYKEFLDANGDPNNLTAIGLTTRWVANTPSTRTPSTAGKNRSNHENKDGNLMTDEQTSKHTEPAGLSDTHDVIEFRSDGIGTIDTKQHVDVGSVTIQRPESPYKPFVPGPTEVTTLNLSVGLRPIVEGVNDSKEKTVDNSKDDSEKDDLSARLNQLRLSVGLPIVKEIPAAMQAHNIINLVETTVSQNYDEILKQFEKADPHYTGFIRRHDMLRIVQDFAHCEFTKPSFTKILHHMNSSRDGDIKYRDFMLKFGGKPAPAIPLKNNRTENRLKPVEAQQPRLQNSSQVREIRTDTDTLDKRIRGLVLRSWEPLKRAFRTRDWQGCGGLKASEFAYCLKQFDLPVDDSELLSVAQRWKHPTRREMVSYMDFLRHYRSLSKKHLKNTAQLRQRSGSEARAPTMGVRPAEHDSFSALRQQVIPKWTSIRRACLKQDPIVTGRRARTGVVPAAAFKRILKQFGIQFSEETFYHIHSFSTPNLKKGVKYDAFFQEVLSSSS